MRLYQLLQPQNTVDLGGLPDYEITALTADSRQVQPGALFVAVEGSNFDGHQFLDDAAERGAVLAIGEWPIAELAIPYIQVKNSRALLANAAAAWHGYPSKSLVLIGVTGTDGKTTTANLLYHILHTAGFATGMITTVNAIIGDRTIDTGLHVTTPDPLEIQALLAQMVRAGMTHCVLEATSHGLAQHRVGGCEFDIAVVTNITHEHLDYHGSYAAYREAKGKLFSELTLHPRKQHGPEKSAILNMEDTSLAYLRSMTEARQFTYGRRSDADVYATDIHSAAEGLQFVARQAQQETMITSPLIGSYNVDNCLAAFTATVKALEMSPEVAAQGISKLEGVPGRMEIIDLGQPFTAMVDFAHTPNALRRSLETSRELTRGRVIAVFGSAGLRDREKRRMMAEVSASLADLTVLTAEDPRTEALDSILHEMAQGAAAKGAQEGETFWCIPDRGEAIRFAVRKAEPGDLVISCGKGHEQSMCFGEIEYDWDDRTALRAALAELLGIEGPEMPQLPTSL